MLSSMGVVHTVNALIEGDLLVVEIALPGQAGQPPTAILVEAPADFTCNMPFRPLGATLLRWRLLLSCDWRVRCMAAPAHSVTKYATTHHSMTFFYHHLSMYKLVKHEVLISWA